MLKDGCHMDVMSSFFALVFVLLLCFAFLSRLNKAFWPVTLCRNSIMIVQSHYIIVNGHFVMCDA